MSQPNQDERLTRENAYLRQRNAQLQEDLTAVSAEAERLRQAAERLLGSNILHSPDSLNGDP